MDAKLKLKLNEAVDAAIAEWKNRVPHGTEPVPIGTDIESKPLTRWMTNFVRNRFRKDGNWAKVQTALAGDALDSIFAKRLKPRAKPVDPNQGMLPGFQHLPRQIRVGNTHLAFKRASVPQFLEFEGKYQTSVERNKQTADELHRVAEAVRQFADTGLTVVEAFERAQQKPAALSLVPPKAAGE